MHIKKFEARDLKDALGRIRAELGPDAVILETGRGGKDGRSVTVLAALPREGGAQAETAETKLGGSARPRPEGRSPMPARLETASESNSHRGLAGAPASAAENPPVFSAQAADPPASLGMFTLPPGGSWEPRSLFTRKPPRRNDEADEEALRERVGYLNRLVRSDHFSAIPLPLRQLYFDLTDAEVDADLAFRVLERLGSAPLPGQFTPAPPAETLQLLRGLIRVGGTVEPGHGRRVLALVGPTGVGKTTTAAKIAGHAAFRLGMSVALVSTDGYRVFGSQHLASYAALMGIPCEAVTRASEMRSLLDGRFAKSDLVLVDTSGRSPRDRGGIREIHELLAAFPDLDIHLVLAANGRARDLALALDAFDALPVRHLLFTKLDEATSRGGVFTTALKARRPVSWLGTGQEVPDDLVAATTEALTDGLTGGTDG